MSFFSSINDPAVKGILIFGVTHVFLEDIETIVFLGLFLLSDVSSAKVFCIADRFIINIIDSKMVMG